MALREHDGGGSSTSPASPLLSYRLPQSNTVGKEVDSFAPERGWQSLRLATTAAHSLQLRTFQARKDEF